MERNEQERQHYLQLFLEVENTLLREVSHHEITKRFAPGIRQKIQEAHHRLNATTAKSTFRSSLIEVVHELAHELDTLLALIITYEYAELW